VDIIFVMVCCGKLCEGRTLDVTVVIVGRI